MTFQQEDSIPNRLTRWIQDREKQKSKRSASFYSKKNRWMKIPAEEMRRDAFFYIIKQRFEIAITESKWQDSPMRAKNQEISFEVATKNETVAVALKPPALVEQLPPLTTEQRELLKQAHPSLQAQLERSLRRKEPTTTTTPPKWPKHYEDALKSAKPDSKRLTMERIAH